MPVLLDTTVLIDALRGRPGVLARLDAIERRGEIPLTCAINIEELFGSLRSSEEEARRAHASGFAGHPPRLARGHTGRRVAEAKRSAWDHLSQGDCLVAAAAVSAGARLATGNPRHFPFDELTVEHWPVGA